MTQTAIPCTVMRGGTSKGLYFRASDLPADTATRDAVLLAAMGSPDPRQIDGMGGAHPLTSKIAVVGPPTNPAADVDYLFLQAVVDEARIDAGQNCGNLLAGRHRAGHRRARDRAGTVDRSHVARQQALAPLRLVRGGDAEASQRVNDRGVGSLDVTDDQAHGATRAGSSR